MSGYDFEPFFDALGDNWYEDDPLLQRLLARRVEGHVSEEKMRRWGARCAGPLRELAETSALLENRPRLRHFDARGMRVDEILLPASTREALAEVEGRERLGAVHGDPFEFYARIYLYAQNGEAGVACSAACTDGLVRVLEALGDRPEHRETVERVRGSDPERVWHGAQFVTEIQGGSDVSANRTRAVPDGDAFRLHGRKWFCSNVNADYYLVTARPAPAPARQDADGAGEAPLGLFLVPAYASPAGRRRNGHTIDRLKEKLGTRELATAELTFDGALAWPVGPLVRGLPNLVRHVLQPSRFACVIFAAAALRRAERIVDAYTGFRTAFGRSLAEYPLVASASEGIGRARRRALAAVFRLLAAWEESARAPAGEAPADARSPDLLLFRVMMSLCKPVLTRRATARLHEAMMLLGGNGIEELFSSLPRLYRDAVIMETWEGPHNVLFTQALRDLRRFDVDPGELVARVAGEERPELERELAAALHPEAPLVEAVVGFVPTAERLVDAWAGRELDAPEE